MFTQGLAFGLFIAFFDGYNALLLGFLAGITSVIPILGTALVWVPIALGEYLAGNTLNAIIIAVYSWAMMAFFIDNVVKLVILNFINRSMSGGEVRTHEFIIFFAIVGGLASFGFWGFVIGPALVAFAITTFKTLRKLSRPSR
jgi:predicted PurR-regulated permease PerM